MHRFYIPSPDIQKNTVTITDPRVVFQCGKVLRMRVGSPFSIFDETGEEHSVSILEIDRHKILCQVTATLARATESAVKISLYQSIPKKPALFELVVQKATELGVSEIYPLITGRTERHRMTKFERLSAIAMEAAEQSNRTRVPLIHHPIDLEDAVERAENGYMAYEFEAGTFLYEYHQELRKKAAVQIFIGPEGGFSQDEINLAKKAGIKLFTLGPRTLRTETAAIASLAFLQGL